jgi:hypothetical protein
MRQRGFSQRPQLTSSQQFDHDRVFSLDDIVPNSNAVIGRTFRRKFPPKPRPILGPLAEMLDGPGMLLMMGAGAVAGSVAMDGILDTGSSMIAQGIASGGSLVARGSNVFGSLLF